MNQNINNTFVTNLPPIVNRRVNVVHTYQIINQPYIFEDITQVCNHTIKRNYCVNKPMCFETNDFQEENCGNCPGINDDNFFNND